MILIDSNVLIDVFDVDGRWADWSMSSIADASSTESLAINAIVVAEVAPQFSSLDHFLQLIAPLGVQIMDFDNHAAYMAGAAFLRYRERRRKGQDDAKSIIADFLIGGHAQVLGATILTRDPRFYKAYFPKVPLIAPSKEDND